MPIADRDYMKKEHPPACTCVSCASKRSARTGKKSFWKRIAGWLTPP